MSLVEKYRPTTLEEVVGQVHLKNKIDNLLSKDYLPHLMLVGDPGVGKTSLAHIIAKLKNYYLLEKNASDERGIDMVRNEVKQFARVTTVESYNGKLILLDESDNLTLDSQAALRRTMERYEKLTTFIFTVNRPERIIDPIKSRCTILNFRRLPDTEILKRILYILKKEGITIDTKKPKIVLGLKELLKYSNGDMRTALNTLESVITKDHEITEESILIEEKPQGVLTMLEYATGGDFEKAKNEVQRIYIQDRFGVGSIVDEVYKSLGELDGLSEEAKIKVYEKLGELERNLKLGTNPLIQLTSFLAFLWVVQYVKVPSECPLNNG